MGEGGEQEGKSKERRCPYARETVYINPLLLSPPPRSPLANDFVNFQQPLRTGVLICSFIQQNIQQIESSCYVSGTFQVLGLVQ